MKLARKFSLTVAATVAVLGASLVTTTAPAHAGDSSWGCGGQCRPGR